MHFTQLSLPCVSDNSFAVAMLLRLPHLHQGLLEITGREAADRVCFELGRVCLVEVVQEGPEHWSSRRSVWRKCAATTGIINRYIDPGLHPRLESPLYCTTVHEGSRIFSFFRYVDVNVIYQGSLGVSNTSWPMPTERKSQYLMALPDLSDIVDAPIHNAVDRFEQVLDLTL